MKRRDFFTRISVILSGFIGVIVALPLLGSLVEPFFEKHPAKWRTIGPIDDFKIGNTELVKFKNANGLPWSGSTDESAAWLRRDAEDHFIAFSINCAHLGCPVRWEKDSQLFLCPCHGGVYYADGSLAAGPPPRGLYHYPARIYNGNVQIQTSPIPISNFSS